MSASSKKKLRKEQSAAQMTEKQRRQKAEDKKIKIYTGIFIAAMALVICITAATLIIRGINNSGIIEKNTIAATIDGHEINSVEMNYFLMDTIDSMYSNWYASYNYYTSYYIKQMYGLDLTKSLDSQIYDATTRQTWGDYFVSIALDDARTCYAMYNKAVADKHTLTAEEQTALNETIADLKDTASKNGYKFNAYLRLVYGNGSDESSFLEYKQKSALARSYLNKYYESLSYTNKDFRDYETEHYDDFTCFTYNTYHLTYDKFLKGGTKNDAGKMEYSDAEINAATDAMNQAAESLKAATSVEDFNKLIAALEINADNKDAKSSEYKRTFTPSIEESLKKWLTDSARKPGDVGVVNKVNTKENEDGSSTTTEDGIYVVYFQERDTNTDFMSDVRHLLVAFEGGTKDSNGNTTYSDQEKETAKNKATELLNTWKSGAATEESFIALVKEKTDDEGSKETGGLYENINPESQYVENFLNWAIDPAREKGNTGIVETEYGYHIMYYVGDSQQTYRDSMIESTLREADYSDWVDAVTNATTFKEGDTSRVNRDVIISSY